MTTAAAPLAVLLVEDNPDDADLLRERLIDAGARQVRLTHVETLREAVARLGREPFDVVLLDLSLPDSQGLATVRGVLSPSAPAIVVLTGLEDETLGAAAVQAGAQDYVMKGQADGALLLRCMRYAVERHRLLAGRTEDAEVWAALARVGEELMAAVTRRALLERLCQLSAEVLGCDSANTWILDETAGVYVAAAADSAAEWERIQALQLPRAALAPLGAARRQDGAALHWLDDRLRQLLPEPLVRMPDEMAAVLYLTLYRGGAIVGTQVCGYRRRGRSWTQVQERIARGIVHIAALALDNGRLIDELERSNTVKTYFAATMSHELRNTLFVIDGFSAMLTEALGDGGATEAPRLARAIGDRARESLQLIQATLELTRSEVRPAPPDAEAVDLNGLLAQLEADTAGSRHQRAPRVDWEVADALPLLRTDPVKLTMILKNLIGNALKFTREGRVRVAVQPHGEGVRFTVADTGIGIDAAEVPHLFEPFRQAHGGLSRRAGGVGLGLYIVGRLVALLGGEIGVESAPECGTTITVHIPCQTDAAPPARV